MVQDGNEFHAETDEARGGSTPHIVRWILGISLLTAIVALSAIWIFGATNADQGGNQAAVERRSAVESPSAATSEDVATGSTTDGIVTDRADEFGTGGPVAPATGPAPAANDE